MLEWIVPVTDVVVALLLMLLGGNLGSFLNVVVHRLPRGESVVTGGSRCPACGSAIRWHDNVPVLGWLLLRGRCRDCGTDIAPRYPLVEAAGAIVLGGVAAVELLSGGGTFPAGVLMGGRSGADNLLLRPDPGLIGMASFHAWVLFNLLLGAAIAIDGGRVPRAWNVTVLLLTLSAVTACDWLLPVGVAGDGWSPGGVGGWAGPARGLAVSLAGIACGAIVGGRVPWSARSEGVRAGLMLVGASSGWQAVVVVALWAALAGWCRRRLVECIPAEEPAEAMDDHAVPAAPPVDAVSCEHPPVGHPLPEEEGMGAGAADRAEGSPCPSAAPARVSSGRRLVHAARGIMALPRWAAGDLVVATGCFFLAWRACVGLWPWKS